MENRLHTKVAMGKSSKDWGFSIDMFDYRRAMDLMGNQYYRIYGNDEWIGASNSKGNPLSMAISGTD